MIVTRALEQHIAVFGESGSGKTVMLSSFYGAAQEPKFLGTSPIRIVAEDSSQGNRLHKNYLGMRDEARPPQPTLFASTSYAFRGKPKSGGGAAPASTKSFDSLRLVWHDYPGEWFEQQVSGEEATRRVDAFRNLLGSDVALVLIDGQRLLDNAGHEQRYLRSVLANIRNGLISISDDLKGDGKPLVKFPRIWMVALSKADLLPDLDVFKFRDLVIRHATDDLDALRDVLAELVESSNALAVGEDFAVFSSAKFTADSIDLTQRKGLDLILPIAAIVPFERHIRWAKEKQLGAKVLEELLDGAGALSAVFLGTTKILTRIADKVGGKLGAILQVAPKALSTAMLAAIEIATDKLRDKQRLALAQHDYITAALTGFRLDLDEAQRNGILLLSDK